MSIAAINWVLGAPRQGEPGLTGPKGADRLVLLSLANHADEDGWSWPSRATICGQANVVDRTCTSSLQWLIEHGYITRDVQGAPSHARQRTNLYRLLFEVERTPAIPAPPCNPQQPTPAIHDIDPLQSTQIALHTSTTTEPKGKPSTADAAFDAFWQVYPRRVGKPAASRAWKAAIKRDGIESIRAGFKRWAAHWRDSGTTEQFIPHPATWLNQQRYLDEVTAVVAATKPTGLLEQMSTIQFDDRGNVIG